MSGGVQHFDDDALAQRRKGAMDEFGLSLEPRIEYALDPLVRDVAKSSRQLLGRDTMLPHPEPKRCLEREAGLPVPRERDFQWRSAGGWVRAG